MKIGDLVKSINSFTARIGIVEEVRGTGFAACLVKVLWNDGETETHVYARDLEVINE
jgi:hypothetical protein